jgi:peptidyl-prolyl cis-trans isomerase B (cyclophilin B)
VTHRTTIALLAGALLLPGCGSDDDKDSAGSKPATTSTTAPVRAGCKAVKAPPAKSDGGQSKPKSALAAGKAYEIVFTTTCGSFTVRLDPKQAPNAGASMAALARSGFYDGTVFHRVVPGFVIQGGDPTGTGAGSPGYTTRDKPAADSSYVSGVVAMAKGGTEPPGAAGSQFFVVTGADAGLPPDYAIVGKVVKGMATAKRIEALGVGDGPPKRPVILEKATLVER